VNRLAGGVLQREALAAVFEAAAVLAGDGQALAILGLEGLDVPDDQQVLRRRQFDAREDEIDPVGEGDQVQIDRLGTDIGQSSLIRTLSATGPTEKTGSASPLQGL